MCDTVRLVDELDHLVDEELWILLKFFQVILFGVFGGKLERVVAQVEVAQKLAMLNDALYDRKEALWVQLAPAQIDSGEMLLELDDQIEQLDHLGLVKVYSCQLDFHQICTPLINGFQDPLKAWPTSFLQVWKLKLDQVWQYVL